MMDQSYPDDHERPAVDMSGLPSHLLMQSWFYHIAIAKRMIDHLP